jgi:hypothetical protein
MYADGSFERPNHGIFLEKFIEKAFKFLAQNTEIF